MEHGPDSAHRADVSGGRSGLGPGGFSMLLEVARTITAATSFTALEAAVRDAALRLLEGDRCHLAPMGQLDDDQLAAATMRRAVETAAPTADPTTRALAAPIVVHGEVASCLFVSSGATREPFGDEELQLAALVTTLAGAAVEHLAATETRFRSLAQNSSDVITLVDASGHISYQSTAAGRVFGNSGSVAGRDVREWAHPDDVDVWERALAARGSTDTRVECRLRHADGSFRHTETVITDLLEEPTVSALVLNTRDITERRRLEDELRERALHDALTGLPNRALFHDRATQALERRSREHAPLSIAFMDLDDFKAINDTFGHAVGDQLLCTIADRLSACVRPTDTVTRLGGDEFAVLLENTELGVAVDVVERMLRAVAVPIPLAGREVVVRASVGITSAEGDDPDPDQLLAHADVAMYAAKATGAHGYELFAPAMQVATEARLALRTEIDRALVRSEFRLHYQPIIDAQTQAAVGMEALIRWQHPERGILAPAQFIDFAEESGQVVDMGRWVLEKACVDAAGLGSRAYVSVNVSARQLQDSRLIEHVRAALAESGIAPSRLTLEITETAAMADTESTIAKLHQLKGLGVQLALDDFGTGYSPLSYLRRFPVDVLKIDRSFVMEIERSSADRAIVKGVIDMAHALDLRAVAEGVETLAQYDVLSALGCDLGQGYLWMRPAGLEAMAAHLALPPPRRSVDRLVPTRVEPPVA